MLRSGKICVSLLYNYITSSLTEDDDVTDDICKKSLKIKNLSKVFDDCGGVLTKISQIMNYQYGVVDSTVFSDCKPYNEKETLKFILDKIDDKNYSKNIQSFDSRVYKSGTIGQIHKVIYNNDEEIVLKVQYVGLLEQFNTDINILRSVIKFLYPTYNNILEDIQNKLYEELDFRNEFRNHNMLYEIWEGNEFIKIPKLIPELCDDKIIGMSLIKGESLNDFINNSTQEERNRIGFLLVEFMFTNLYKHNIFYNDSHYGNFIIENKNTLHIVDFGSINFYDNEKVNLLKLFHMSIAGDDIDSFYDCATKLGLINDETSKESRDFLFPCVKRLSKPWVINEEFEFTEQYIVDLVVHETNLSAEWKLAGDMIYLAKIPFGLCNILQKLNVKCNFTNLFNKLIYS